MSVIPDLFSRMFGIFFTYLASIFVHLTSCHLSNILRVPVCIVLFCVVIFRSFVHLVRAAPLPNTLLLTI